MTSENMQKLLTEGEGFTVEFKKCQNQLGEDTVFETVSAFSNRYGGWMLIGVDDDGIVLGVNPRSVEQMKRNFANTLNNPERVSPTMTRAVGDEDVNDTGYATGRVENETSRTADATSRTETETDATDDAIIALIREDNVSDCTFPESSVVEMPAGRIFLRSSSKAIVAMMSCSILPLPVCTVHFDSGRRPRYFLEFSQARG